MHRCIDAYIDLWLWWMWSGGAITDFLEKVFVNRSMAFFQNQKRKTLHMYPRAVLRQSQQQVVTKIVDFNVFTNFVEVTFLHLSINHLHYLTIKSCKLF